MAWRFARVISPAPDRVAFRAIMTSVEETAYGNTCYHMMVLWAMERFKIDLISFECEAVGEVEEHIDRTSWFKTLTLYPKLVVKGKPAGVVQRALDRGCTFCAVRHGSGQEPPDPRSGCFGLQCVART
ncbi:MAG: hypothetical protein LLG06_01195 [Desulfobacteraceae bacterium]|nr:hypothetical protein [Desulfobacteraceae bacterium]